MSKFQKRSKQGVLLAIDPSILRCGVSWFRRDKLLGSDVLTHRTRGGVAVRHNYNCRAKSRKRNESKLDYMVKFVHEFFTQYVTRAFQPTEIIIEKPQIFFSKRGKAANNSGAVLKLTGFVYALRELLAMEYGVRAKLINVTKWKGQTPKKITMMRVVRRFNIKPIDHNEADAIGLGHWYIKQMRFFGGIRPI